MSGSARSEPWLTRRTFAVSVFPLRRNSVTSAVMPFQFVCCEASAAAEGAAAVVALAGAGAETGAGAGAGADAGAAAEEDDVVDAADVVVVLDCCPAGLLQAIVRRARERAKFTRFMP